MNQEILDLKVLLALQERWVLQELQELKVCLEMQPTQGPLGPWVIWAQWDRKGQLAPLVHLILLKH